MSFLKDILTNIVFPVNKLVYILNKVSMYVCMYVCMYGGVARIAHEQEISEIQESFNS